MAWFGVWPVAIGVAIGLGVTARSFGLRTLRLVSFAVALALAGLITRYGAEHLAAAHPAAAPPNLGDAFIAGLDALIMTLLRLPLVGAQGPPPGPIGRGIFALLILVGYRALEWWALQRQAPQLNVAKLTDDRPGGAIAGAEGEANARYAQMHSQLTAELRFRLAAIDVRAPAILPGGSRAGGLASIAEASGVSGGGLAGAVIRFLGSIWPNPRQLRLRVWVERQSHQPAPGCMVTAYLENPRTGETVDTKTLAGQDVDEAASLVAGFVARQVFVEDPATPPWCYGRADGADLAALLRARQERAQTETPQVVTAFRGLRVRTLRDAASGGKAAGVARYELAQLLDLESDHLGALLLHARNLHDYPRFYRGLYRLGISLEMIAAPGRRLPDTAETRRQLDEVLGILHREYRLTNFRHRHDRLTERGQREPDDLRRCADDPEYCTLSPSLRLDLLIAAARVLRTVRTQLAFGHPVWATFWHRDERTIWLPYWTWWLPLRKRVRRVAFHDGVCVAELLVAIRIKFIERDLATARHRNDAALAAMLSRAADLVATNRKWLHYWRGIRTVSAIAGDRKTIAWVLDNGCTGPGQPPQPPDEPPERGIRGMLGRRKTWQAAYNAACLYAALVDEGLASQGQVVRCLRRTVGNPRNETEHASDWIACDPDLNFLATPDRGRRPAGPTPFKRFLDAQVRLDYPAAYPASAQPEPGAEPPARVPGPRQAILRDRSHQPVGGDPFSDHIT